MKPLFTSECFGRSQVIAALMLLAFLLQCVWLVNRTLAHHSVFGPEQERINEGLRQWHGRGIAGMPEPNSANMSSPGRPRDAYDANRSPLWYLVASAPFAVFSEPIDTTTVPASGWLGRSPYFVFGLLLGASLWYVSRRLFGNAGGYIALSLYCFSPAMIITTSAGSFVEPEMGSVWASFGAVFTAIAVAHTLYAPREVVLWNRRRIALLALSLALAVGSQFSLIILLPLTLVFMWWVAPDRRGAALAIWGAAVILAAVQLWAAYGFHSLAMWRSFENANLFKFSGQAFVTPGVYRQVAAVIAKSSPALMIALPATLAVYVGWARSRYFGNTAPLLVAIIFLVLGMANPHFPGAGFYLVAVVFLFVFVAGIAVDLLETRHRQVVLASVVGLLSASAFWNILQLLRM
jgi:MFS family permease